MFMTYVKYRTKTDIEQTMTDNWVTHYAVIPTIWLSDLLAWLSDIDAKLCATADNVEFEARLPINWPSYETCHYCMQVSDAIHCVL